MKIGIAFGKENRLLEPGDYKRVAPLVKPESLCMLRRLYPNQVCAFVSPYSPDMDICQKLDVIVYYTGGPDSVFFTVMESIPCKIITAMVGANASYGSITGGSIDNILLRKRIFDKSDFVMVWDQGAVDLLALYTQTPIICFPLPMPIELALEAVKEPNTAPQFDIVIPYGPYISQIRRRNGIVSALLAQRMVDKFGFNRFAIFNNTSKIVEVEQSYKFLRDLGCRDFELFSRTAYSKFIKILAKSRIGLDLDMCRGVGKFAIDCAVLRKPAILSNTLSYAQDIYKGQESILCDPLDVKKVMRLAASVANGDWANETLELVYNRAVDKYNLVNAARVLEEAIYNGATSSI